MSMADLLLESGDPLKGFCQTGSEDVVVFVLHSESGLEKFDELLSGDLVKAVNDGSGSRSEGLLYSSLFEFVIEVFDSRAYASLGDDLPSSGHNRLGGLGCQIGPSRTDGHCGRNRTATSDAYA